MRIAMGRSVTVAAATLAIVGWIGSAASAGPGGARESTGLPAASARSSSIDAGLSPTLVRTVTGQGTSTTPSTGGTGTASSTSRSVYPDYLLTPFAQLPTPSTTGTSSTGTSVAVTSGTSARPNPGTGDTTRVAADPAATSTPSVAPTQPHVLSPSPTAPVLEVGEADVLDGLPWDEPLRPHDPEPSLAEELAILAQWWPQATIYAEAPPAPEPAAADDTLAAQLAEAGITVSDDGWVNPLPNGRYVSGYGFRGPIAGVIGAMFHAGVDLAAPLGYPIRAASAGTVSYVGNGNRQFGLSGWAVVVDHGDGVQTSYNHMAAPGVLVRVGDQVEAGQIIALVGSEGRASGPHLHFGTYVNGKSVDPYTFMLSRGIDLKSGKSVTPVPLTADWLAAQELYHRLAAALPTTPATPTTPTAPSTPTGPETPTPTPSPTTPATPKPTPSPSPTTPSPSPSPTPTPTDPSPTPTPTEPTPSPTDPSTPTPTPSEPTPEPSSPAPESPSASGSPSSDATSSAAPEPAATPDA
ncbi:MAG: M23 family metallopeptidase [Salana multivorans]|nr:M23 family metallopeptidase [Salana multivorans]